MPIKNGYEASFEIELICTGNYKLANFYMKYTMIPLIQLIIIQYLSLKF